jgi:hypothetical protein
MSEQPTDPDAERARLTQELWTVLGVYDRNLPSTALATAGRPLTATPFSRPPTKLRHVLDAQRGSILYTHHGHLYRVTLTVTAED